MQAFAMTWAKRSVFITVAFVQKITDVKDKPGKSTTKPKDQSQVFNDPIHGHVELHPLLVKIINTRQFDRLRHLRQLGAAYYVFPGACHNRFEHSIGVAHLAGQFAQALKKKQPELGITDEDVLCVQIAGLCHDLGHGPFSHLFDGMFIPRARRGEKRTHEDHSLKMFDLMVKENKLKEEMQKYKLKPERDIIFIKEMMTGKPLKNGKEEQVANSPASVNESSPDWQGRDEDKSFLYEIVANHTNEIDVDKFDYFARDCHHLGIQNHFDHHRFSLFARVCEVDEKNGKKKKHICVREKEVHNLYEMFYARCSFHRKAYQHRVNSLIQTMITDAFLKADIIHFPIEGSGGKKFTLSTAIDDMEAYTKLTDRVFEDILHHPSHELKEAKEILERIINRDLYKCVGTVVTTNKKMTEEVKKRWNKSTPIDGLTADDFALVDTSLGYGYGEKDPISRVCFYSKEKPDEAKPIPKHEVSRLLPEHFSEGSVRVYLKKKENDEKKNEKNLEDAKKHFRQLFKDFVLKDENKRPVARPRQAVKTSSESKQSKTWWWWWKK